MQTSQLHTLVVKLTTVTQSVFLFQDKANGKQKQNGGFVPQQSRSGPPEMPFRQLRGAVTFPTTCLLPNGQRVLIPYPHQQEPDGRWVTLQRTRLNTVVLRAFQTSVRARRQVGHTEIDPTEHGRVQGVSDTCKSSTAGGSHCNGPD